MGEEQEGLGTRGETDLRCQALREGGKPRGVCKQYCPTIGGPKWQLFLVGSEELYQILVQLSGNEACERVDRVHAFEGHADLGPHKRRRLPRRAQYCPRRSALPEASSLCMPAVAPSAASLQSQ